MAEFWWLFTVAETRDQVVLQVVTQGVATLLFAVGTSELLISTGCHSPSLDNFHLLIHDCVRRVLQ